MSEFKHFTPGVIYVAHPVGFGLEERLDNLEAMRTWFLWLLKKHPYDALVAPYDMYVRCLPETPENRARGIRDDLSVLAKCDGIILCGERISNGMLGELMNYIKKRSETGSKINVYNYVGSKLPPEESV